MSRFYCYPPLTIVRGVWHLDVEINHGSVTFSVPAEKGSELEEVELRELEILLKLLNESGVKNRTTTRDTPAGPMVDRISIDIKNG